MASRDLLLRELLCGGKAASGDSVGRGGGRGHRLPAQPWDAVEESDARKAPSWAAGGTLDVHTAASGRCSLPTRRRDAWGRR